MRYFLLIIAIFFLSAFRADAASLALKNVSAPGAGTIAVDVVANTDGSAINSIEASVQYPDTILSFSGYQSTSGVVKFWIEQPHASGGVVRFAGGIPGGVAQQYGTQDTGIALVRLIFTPKQAGAADLSIANSTLLLNDGLGTALPHTTEPLHVAVTLAAAASTDTTPPEPFLVTLVPKDHATGTPQMISFAAEDRESGIASYQVKSGFGFWHAAESPYRVRGGLFSHVVYVKATDVYGNSTVEHVRAPGLLPAWSAFALGVLIAVSIWRFFVIKKKV